MNAIYPHTEIEPAGDVATGHDHPDAVLLALQREIDEADAEWLEATVVADAALEKAAQQGGSYNEALNALGHPTLEAAADKIRDGIYAIELRIGATPAHSFVGLAIKLRLASDTLCPGSDTADGLALMSAWQDAERLAHAV